MMVWLLAMVLITIHIYFVEGIAGLLTRHAVHIPWGPAFTDLRAPTILGCCKKIYDKNKT